MRFEQLRALRQKILAVHNEGEEKDLLNNALLDSLNDIYSRNLPAVKLVSLRLEAAHLKTETDLTRERKGMSLQELQASYADQISQLKRTLAATEMLTDLTEAGAAKTAEELEDAKAIIEGMSKQSKGKK